MTWNAILKPKKVTKKPIINQAIENKNTALNDAYNYQNQNIATPRKIKKINQK